MAKVTRDEFVQRWVKQSQCTFDDLETIGLIAIPCECGAWHCPGWNMVNVCHLTEEQIDDLDDEYKEQTRALQKKLLGQGD